MSSCQEHEIADCLKTCRPEVRDEPAEHVFEIGLVLAGAISGGAYTAGVLDYLFEALDAWHAAKAAEREKHGDDYAKWAVPPHEVRVRVIAGASAGALCGAISLAAARYRFPHVSLNDESGKADNPFYRAWVSGIDIQKLLKNEDFEKNPDQVSSLLDSSCLDQIATEAINFQGTPIGREYLANPLRLAVSLTNLRGVRHVLDFRSPDVPRHVMQEHRDWMSFSLGGLGSDQAEPTCPDEYLLDPNNNASAQSWGDLSQVALASAAFPAGLRARELKRPYCDYCFRRLASGCDPDRPNQLAAMYAYGPNLAADPSGGEYAFTAVDGGVMNNEPLELARQFLSGPLGMNPRDGVKTRRGVIMIDPFPESSTESGKNPENGRVLKILASMFGAWKNQCRFTPEELVLAAAEDVYSRYMIAPTRGDGRRDSKNFDLASSVFGGFGGFLSESFRRHDYFLGRRNCQRFLEKTFCLPQQAKLFSGWKNPALASDVRFNIPIEMADGSIRIERPIIPLVGDLHPAHSLSTAEPLPRWPSGYSPESLKPLIKKRAQWVFTALKTETKPGVCFRLLLNIGWWFSKGKLIDKIMAHLKDDLDRHGLS